MHEKCLCMNACMHDCVVKEQSGLSFKVTGPRMDTASGELRLWIVVTKVLTQFPNCNLSHIYHGSTGRHPFHDYL